MMYSQIDRYSNTEIKRHDMFDKWIPSYTDLKKLKV